MIVRQQPAWLTLALLVAMNTTACGPSIEDLDLEDDGTVSDDTGTDDTGTDDTGTVDTDDTTGPTDTLQIDASDADTWVYVDLAAGSVVTESDVCSLAFKRFEVKLNGGISGDGGVEVVWIDDAYGDVTEAPAAGWMTDEAGGDTDVEDALALANWYDYDPATHVLTPAAGTWAIRGADGATYKLVFTTYYDDAGTSGFPTLRFDEIDDPDRGTTATFDGSDSLAPAFVVLDTLGEVNAPAEPGTSLAWDLQIARTAIKVNGGFNGSGDGQAYTYPDGTAWGDVTVAPTSGWQDDVAPPSPYQSGTALETWYDYDPSTHAVSPSGAIHAVKDAAGHPYKLTVVGWDDGMVTLRVAPLDAP